MMKRSERTESCQRWLSKWGLVEAIYPDGRDEHQIGISHLILLTGVCLLAIFLGIYRLAENSLWGDELNLIWFMTGERDLELSSGNALGFLPILRFMKALGGSDFLYRLPAVIAGTICVPLLYAVGIEMKFDRTTALIASVCLAVSPTFIVHMQQVHVYTLFCAVSLLALLFYLRARNRGSYLAWIACAVTIATGFHIHLFMIFVVVNLAIIHVVHLTRNGRWRSVGAVWDRRYRWMTVGSTVVCLIILWPLLINWIFPLGGDLMAKLLGGSPRSAYLGRPPQFNLDFDLLGRLAHQMVVWKTPYRWVVIAFSLLCLTGLCVMAHRCRDSFIIVFVWVFLPPVPIAIFSYISNIDFGTRRVIFILPVLMISVAYGLRWASRFPGKAFTADRRQWFQTAMSVLWVSVYVVVFSATTLRYYYRHVEYPDTRRTAFLLEQCGQPGDLVVAWRPERFRYYYRGQLPFTDLRETQIPSLRAALQEGRRIWYFRPAQIDRRRFGRPIAKWFDSHGGFRFTMGGGLSVSLIPRNRDDPAAYHAEMVDVIEMAVRLKPDRYYLHARLADIYKRLGRMDDFAEQRQLARKLRL
jgi:hypothetical protein